MRLGRQSSQSAALRCRRGHNGLSIYLGLSRAVCALCHSRAASRQVWQAQGEAHWHCYAHGWKAAARVVPSSATPPLPPPSSACCKLRLALSPPSRSAQCHRPTGNRGSSRRTSPRFHCFADFHTGCLGHAASAGRQRTGGLCSAAARREPALGRPSQCRAWDSVDVGAPRRTRGDSLDSTSCIISHQAAKLITESRVSSMGRALPFLGAHSTTQPASKSSCNLQASRQVILSTARRPNPSCSLPRSKSSANLSPLDLSECASGVGGDCVGGVEGSCV